MATSDPDTPPRERARDCFIYKVFGECPVSCPCPAPDKKCSRPHKKVAKIVYYNYITIPKKCPLRMIPGKRGVNFKYLNGIEKCHVCVFAERRLVRIVSCRDLKSQKKLIEELKVFMSKEYPIGPKRCYITGIDLKFKYTFKEHTEGHNPVQSVRGRMRTYQLVPTGEDVHERCTLEEIAARSPQTAEDTEEGLSQALNFLCGENIDETQWAQTIRIVDQPKTSIKEALDRGLAWLRRRYPAGQGHNTRLDARFGRILWSALSEDVIEKGTFEMEKIADVLFSDSSVTSLFSSDVRRECTKVLCEQLQSDDRICSPPVKETFDFKLTLFKKEIRLNIKVQLLEGEKCDVLQVKKDEIKLLVFDVLALNRAHDFRISLHDYEVVCMESPLYDIVERFRQSISASASTVCFPVRTDDWNIHLVRHKKERTFVLEDKKYAVTVVDIKEHTFYDNYKESERKRTIQAKMSIDDVQYHSEVEFHNLAWECAFGREAGYSPDQTLALYMEEGTVDPAAVAEASPHPWQPDGIMQDFEDTWQNIDNLNELLCSSTN